MTSTVTNSRQAVTVAALALRETLTFAESLGLTPDWTDEATLMLHWQRLKGLAGLPGRRQRSIRPFGRPVVAVGVACALTGDTPCMPGYLLVNHAALERATSRQLLPIYEAIVAATMAIRHIRQFTASFTAKKQSWPLSQAVVLARGERFYLDPLDESLRCAMGDSVDLDDRTL